MPIIIDGKATSQKIKEQIKIDSQNLFETKGIKPGLALLLVGHNPASEIYVKMKDKTCQDLGFKSIITRMDENSSQEDVISLINDWNNDTTIHGILVQLPLPKQINEFKVLNTISPSKDVDGFHPVNIGKLLIGLPSFVPCTPAGIMELFHHYDIDLTGKHAVVIGRSNIVGKPIANLLLQKGKYANATVTICHSATKDITKFTKEADVIVAAIGSPNFVTGDMVKDGVVIIDVGINRIDDLTSTKGYKIVGDVEFDSVAPKASAITPVPGGVGPMTIALLMQNTYNSAIGKYEI